MRPFIVAICDVKEIIQDSFQSGQVHVSAGIGIGAAIAGGRIAGASFDSQTKFAFECGEEILLRLREGDGGEVFKFHDKTKSDE